jgi:hypothetical protein
MSSKFPPKRGWLSSGIGNIVHGPGSYYLDDESITQRFTDIITHQEAHAKILELLKDDRLNPPIMWQITDPWGNKPGHLIVHKLKFLRQNLDADTAPSGHKINVEDIPSLNLLNWQGLPHPEGNHVYYLKKLPKQRGLLRILTFFVITAAVISLLALGAINLLQ